jgi:hypothetical protein
MLRRHVGPSPDGPLLGEDGKEGYKKHTGAWRAQRWKLIALLLCGMALGSVCLWKGLKQEENRDPRYRLPLQSRFYHSIDPSEDQIVLQSLRVDDIVQIERYGAGLADKYVCVLSSGYQALIKPMEDPRYFFPWHVPLWEARKMSPSQNHKIGRLRSTH